MRGGRRELRAAESRVDIVTLGLGPGSALPPAAPPVRSAPRRPPLVRSAWPLASSSGTRGASLSSDFSPARGGPLAEPRPRGTSARAPTSFPGQRFAGDRLAGDAAPRTRSLRDRPPSPGAGSRPAGRSCYAPEPGVRAPKGKGRLSQGRRRGSRRSAQRKPRLSPPGRGAHGRRLPAAPAASPRLLPQPVSAAAQGGLCARGSVRARPTRAFPPQRASPGPGLLGLRDPRLSSRSAGAQAGLGLQG